MKLIIEDDEGRKTVVPFVREEITIGRQEGNTIRLTERNVSRRHARLVRQNGHALVEDLGSYNGIRVNGERIQGQMQVPVKDGDLIQIGDYDLAIQTEAAAQAAASATAAAKAEPHEAEETPAQQSVPDDDVPEAEAELDEEAEQEAAAPAAAAEAEHEAPPLAAAEPTRPSIPIPAAASAPAPDRAKALRNQSTAIIRVDQVAGRPEERPSATVLDLDAEEAPRLFVLSPPFEGREFACIRTDLKIGRTEENDIALDHRSLSRTHARLVREETGEWKVIDMGSANGLRVNGETYAQVALSSGDELELGHIKLRFLAAGEKFKPGAGNAKKAKSAGGGKSKVAIVIPVAVLVVLGGGFAAMRMRGGGRGPEVATPNPSTEVPAVQVSDGAVKLRDAEAALAKKDYDRAIDILERLNDSAAKPPEGAAALLERAKAEKEAAKPKKDPAAAVVTTPPPTPVVPVVVAPPPTPAPPVTAPAGPDKSEAAAQLAKKAEEEIDDFVERARKETSELKPLNAINLLKQCVKLHPEAAKCHLRLGSTYSKLKDADNGARHYKLFLKYAAPDDPYVEKVKDILNAEQH